MTTPFHSVESAIASFRAGEMVVIVDTNPSQTCGVLASPAVATSNETIRFLLQNGRGAICVAVDQSICLRFGLRPMDGTRTDQLTFAMSFSLVARPTQSASDRAAAVKALVNPATSPEELTFPGFVQPLMTTESGVLESATFANATTDLCRMAEVPPAAVTSHVLRTDGEMARLEDLFSLATAHRMKTVSIESLVAFRQGAG